MPFKFSLATLLKYREEIERQEERLLEQRRHQLVQLQARLDAAVANRDKVDEEICQQLEKGLLGHDLHCANTLQQQLLLFEEQLRAQLAAARGQYEEQMRKFQHVRMQREKLSELRSQHSEVYERQQERMEQQQIDELFLARKKWKE